MPRTPAGASRAVTSSPGRSSEKPSTSNPHATLLTVAGATAVTMRSVMAVPPTDRGHQVVPKRTVEIVHRFEAPIAPRRRVVDVGRPRIDDRLPLVVDVVGDRRLRERFQHHAADFARRPTERP